MFQILKSSSRPLGDQLVDEMSRLIASGRLPEGARLPSVRALARRAGVSIYTVTTSFERLQARGLIEPRPGSGHFVARRRKSAALAHIELGPPPSADAGLHFAMASLSPAEVRVPAGSGFLPAGWFEEAVPRSIFTRYRSSGAAACPTSPQGDPALREILVERLRVWGITAAARDLVITVGASQGFDLIARSLLAPGDTVLVDDPGYFVLFTQLKAHRLNLVPVPKCADGSALDVLEDLARRHRPRMFVTQTLLHNPTGFTASVSNCHGILKIAERYDFLLAEDHIYSDLAAPHLASLAQIDELRRVIYVGSFTKVLCPDIRVGFLAAPAAYVPQLLHAKMLAVLSGSALDEFVVREVLGSGKYRRHIERLRDRLVRARATAADLLGQAGVTIEQLPQDGYFLWGRLPEWLDASELAAEARAAGILLAQGPMFSLSGAANRYLRLNAAYAADPLLLQFLRERCGDQARPRLRAPGAP